jgi:hypothetical protein
MKTNPNHASADWHLSFFFEHTASCYDEAFESLWGRKIGDSFVTAVGYYVSSGRIQTGHALIQLSRDVTRAQMEEYLSSKRLGSYCLFPVRGCVMPQFLVDKLERSHGTFATFSVKELCA